MSTRVVTKSKVSTLYADTLRMHIDSSQCTEKNFELFHLQQRCYDDEIEACIAERADRRRKQIVDAKKYLIQSLPL